MFTPDPVRRQATVYLHAQGLEAQDEVARADPGARLSGQRGDLALNAPPDPGKRFQGRCIPVERHLIERLFGVDQEP